MPLCLGCYGHRVLQTRTSSKRQQAPELPLRIGLDGEALRTPVSGVGQYVFNVACELERLLPNALFFAYSRVPKERLKLPSERWTVRLEEHRFLRKLPSFLWLKTRGRALCERDQLDVFWAARTLHPNLNGSTRTVSTVHDLNHMVVPETMQSSTLWSARLWFNKDVRTATSVVSNSEGTAARLRSLLHVSANAVCPPGLSDGFNTIRDEALDRRTVENLDLRPPYLLWVGTLEPRKNVGLLVSAFVDLKKRNELRGHSLVLVGAKGWQSSGLAKLIREAQSYGVRVTGYVPDEAMPAIYARATALVFPSVYEGFGMPVLEARACGTPVVISDIPELREAAGDGAITFDGTSVDLKRSLIEVTGAPRALASDASDHSWATTAKKFCEVLTAARPPIGAANVYAVAGPR